mmetsp:Transcript_4710/g.17788  ORF Transcript_4710/g.17788 Transcript_4710/m.17788 type:complete len:247 (+) Transcript_4710:436-1176(+)
MPRAGADGAIGGAGAGAGGAGARAGGGGSALGAGGGGSSGSGGCSLFFRSISSAKARQRAIISSAALLLVLAAFLGATSCPSPLFLFSEVLDGSTTTSGTDLPSTVIRKVWRSSSGFLSPSGFTLNGSSKTAHSRTSISMSFASFKGAPPGAETMHEPFMETSRTAKVGPSAPSNAKMSRWWAEIPFKVSTMSFFGPRPTFTGRLPGATRNRLGGSPSPSSTIKLSVVRAAADDAAAIWPASPPAG